MFERVATQQGWPMDVWPTQLAGLLSGDALDAFTPMPLLEANDYSKVWAAILSRYEVNAETYRLRFRDNVRKSNESYRMFLSRLSDQLTRWIKATEMDLQELILLEQFLKTLPRDLVVWLGEQKPTCATKAAEMADDYEVARKSEGGISGSAPSQKPTSAPKTSSASFFQPQRSKTNHRGEIQCHWCKEWGHIQAGCPQRQLQSGVKAISKPAYLSTNTEPGCEDRFVKDARLDGEPIKILLDTGSKMSIVKADLVNQARWNIEEDRMPIQCVHGDQLTYPTAVVLLKIDGWSKVLKVALVPQMPVDMIVGAGDYCPDGILPTLAHKNDEPGCLMVTTRSQSKKIITQKGPAAGTSDNSPESKEKKITSESHTSTDAGTSDNSSESEEKGITSKSHIGTDLVVQATAEQLKHWQQEDESLREVRRMATSEEMQVASYGRATFFYKEGILYRRWVPRIIEVFHPLMFF